MLLVVQVPDGSPVLEVLRQVAIKDGFQPLDPKADPQLVLSTWLAGRIQQLYREHGFTRLRELAVTQADADFEAHTASITAPALKIDAGGAIAI